METSKVIILGKSEKQLLDRMDEMLSKNNINSAFPELGDEEDGEELNSDDELEFNTDNIKEEIKNSLDAQKEDLIIQNKAKQVQKLEEKLLQPDKISPSIMPKYQYNCQLE